MRAFNKIHFKRNNNRIENAEQFMINNKYTYKSNQEHRGKIDIQVN